jgi:acylphosphatase
MYRDFAQRHARALRLTGEVENLSDGTVKVTAEGTREVLDAFVMELHHGSFFADVNDVSPTFLPATGEFKKFSIRR